jgi:hypothetical protein
MMIEGVSDPEPLRDFLYAQMRGAKSEEQVSPNEPDDDAIEVLQEIRDELRRLRTSQGSSGA